MSFLRREGKKWTAEEGKHRGFREKKMQGKWTEREDEWRKYLVKEGERKD